MKDQIMTLDFMRAPLYDEQGEIQYLIPSAIDISDRTRSETELRDSELRFRRVFDSAADGLICVVQQGRITLCNPRALEMFGYSAEELNNQPIEVLVPSELTTPHQKRRQHYLRQPSSRRMSERTELYARRKDGLLFPVDIGLTQLNMTGDAKVLATVTDITAQKLAQQKLQLIVDEKSQLRHERTTLLNEVHHRVKNNLQIISSLLNLQCRHAGTEVRQARSESKLWRCPISCCTKNVIFPQLHSELIYGRNLNYSASPAPVLSSDLCHYRSHFDAQPNYDCRR